jgi:hypothetical protein
MHGIKTGLRSLLVTYAYAVPVLLGVLATLGGCAGAQPCSREALALTQAECAVKIKATCAEGDRLCPAYVECKQRIENWRVCK